jgi:hypothetical protein
MSDADRVRLLAQIIAMRQRLAALRATLAPTCPTCGGVQFEGTCLEGCGRR